MISRMGKGCTSGRMGIIMRGAFALGRRRRGQKYLLMVIFIKEILNKINFMV